MTIQALAWVIEHSETEGAQRLVLIALANHYSREGICFVSYETLAKEARVHRATAFRAIADLEAGGHIEVTRVNRPHRSDINRYRICFPQADPQPVDERGTRVSECDPSAPEGSHLVAGRVASDHPKGRTMRPEPKENQELTAACARVEHLSPDQRARAKAELRGLRERIGHRKPASEDDDGAATVSA